MHAPEADTLLGEATETIRKQLQQHINKGGHDLESQRRAIRQATVQFVRERTKRRPMVVPVVIEV